MSYNLIDNLLNSLNYWKTRVAEELVEGKSPVDNYMNTLHVIAMLDRLGLAQTLPQFKPAHSNPDNDIISYLDYAKNFTTQQDRREAFTKCLAQPFPEEYESFEYPREILFDTLRFTWILHLVRSRREFGSFPPAWYDSLFTLQKELVSSFMDIKLHERLLSVLKAEQEDFKILELSQFYWAVPFLVV
jgi:hypothetical protein